MVGLNPEFAHETMSGLSFHHAVAQTLWHGKLFHIDLNAQRIGKYDQDFRFGSEGIRDAFYLVKLLEDSGWDGMRHFDAHAVPHRGRRRRVGLRRAAACARYLILAEKARALPRRRRDPGGARRRRKVDAAGASRRARRPLERGRALRASVRRGRARGAGLRPRAARPARHRAAPRRPLMPLVAGVDSSTQAVQGRGARRRHRRARRARVARRTRRPRRPAASRTRRPGGTRSRPRATRPGPRDGRRRSRSPASSTASSCSTPPARCCGRPSSGTTPSRRPTPTGCVDAARRRGVGGRVRQRPGGRFTITKLRWLHRMRARRVRAASPGCCCPTTG